MASKKSGSGKSGGKKSGSSSSGKSANKKSASGKSGRISESSSRKKGPITGSGGKRDEKPKPGTGDNGPNR